MAFICTCPACGHEERRPRADYPSVCPKCRAGWLGDLRADPPVALDSGWIKKATDVLEQLVAIVECMSPEEALTAAGVVEEAVKEELSPATQALYLALAASLEERARGTFND
jgi:hypothetical protein